MTTLRVAVGALDGAEVATRCADVAPGSTFVETLVPQVFSIQGDGTVDVGDAVVTLRAAVGLIQLDFDVAAADVVNPAGGLLLVRDGELAGLEIEFSPGTLAEPTNVWVAAPAVGETSAGDLAFFRIEPGGLVFSPSAVVRLPSGWREFASEGEDLSMFSFSTTAAAIDVVSELSVADRLVSLNNIDEAPSYQLEHLSAFLVVPTAPFHLVLDIQPSNLREGDLLYYLTREVLSDGFDWQPGHAALLTNQPEIGSILHSTPSGWPGCVDVGVQRSRWDREVGRRTENGRSGYHTGHIYMGARRPRSWSCPGPSDCEQQRRAQALSVAASAEAAGATYQLIDAAQPAGEELDCPLIGCNCYSCVGLTEKAYRTAGVEISPTDWPLIPVVQFRATDPVHEIELDAGETLSFSVRGVIDDDVVFESYQDDPALLSSLGLSWSPVPGGAFDLSQATATAPYLFSFTPSEGDYGRSFTATFTAESEEVHGWLSREVARSLTIHVIDDRCVDVDLDGFESITCGGTDCDDSRSAVHPDAGEDCANGRDDDCDGAIDVMDDDCTMPVCSVSPLSVDFGEVAVGDVAYESFVVSNEGSAPLYYERSRCSGDLGEWSGLVEGWIQPGQSERITLQFAPTEPGTFECVVDNGRLCQSVRAVGVGVGVAACELTPNRIEFGSVPIGETVYQWVEIENTGSETVTGSVWRTCGWFDIVEGSGAFSLAPGDVRSVRVAFTPRETGLKECLITTDSLCGSVPVSGTGLSATCPSDSDHDGYGSPGDASCPGGPAEDCDDAAPSVNPAAAEICGNSVDDDCNGLVDSDDPSCPIGNPTFVLTWTYGDGNTQGAQFPGEGPDIDLWVLDPLGQLLSSSRYGFALGPTPEGGAIDHDDLGAYGLGDGGGPERGFWPEGAAPLGLYEFGVLYYQGSGSVSYTLRVFKNEVLVATHAGELLEPATQPGQPVSIGTISNP